MPKLGKGVSAASHFRRMMQEKNMRVKAKTTMYYNRRQYAAGETYEMDDREHGDAKLLETLGKIEILKDETAKRTVQTRTMAPEQPKAPAEPHPVQPMTTQDNPLAGGGTDGPRRYYRRRDLKAEQ